MCSKPSGTPSNAPSGIAPLKCCVTPEAVALFRREGIDGDRGLNGLVVRLRRIHTHGGAHLGTGFLACIAGPDAGGVHHRGGMCSSGGHLRGVGALGHRGVTRKVFVDRDLVQWAGRRHPVGPRGAFRPPPGGSGVRATRFGAPGEGAAHGLYYHSTQPDAHRDLERGVRDAAFDRLGRASIAARHPLRPRRASGDSLVVRHLAATGRPAQGALQLHPSGCGKPRDGCLFAGWRLLVWLAGDRLIDGGWSSLARRVGWASCGNLGLRP
jgi:hypothetical protein